MNKKKRLEIRERIKEVFKDLAFDEKTHTYFLKSDPSFRFTSSVSKIANSFSPDFDSNYWAKKESEKTGENKEEILARWKSKAEEAMKRGTVIHKELEEYTQDNRKRATDVTKRIAKWLVLNGYQLIGNEIRLYDKKSKISGTFDCLVYNSFEDAYYIIDYKTNREKLIEKVESYIDKKTGEKKKSKFLLKAPFNSYPSSNYYKYSIQLSLYKYILEKHTDIKVKGLILIQISDLLFPEEGFCTIPAEIMKVDFLFENE